MLIKNRSHKKELLDAENIPEKDLFQNLKELHNINKYLGGYRISLNALKKILKKNKSNVLVDIGCGGGDSLKQIHQWSRENNYKLQLFGIDLKQSCIDYAGKNNMAYPDIQFICDDYRHANKHISGIDILHASLFCHHLSEAEIIELINFSIDNKITLVINDLERNAIAYFAIKLLTRLFSGSYLVKNDAPLSVLRGFKKKEWITVLKRSGAVNYSIENKWAFRHEIIIYP